jgi:hypothetical protein
MLGHIALDLGGSMPGNDEDVGYPGGTKAFEDVGEKGFVSIEG